MAIKEKEIELLRRGEGCLGRAAMDEPVFILRAKDPAATLVVRIWCQIAHGQGLHEPDKITDAFALAQQMDDWRKAHFEPWRWTNG
jgi:hypothetical protein